MNRSRRRGTAVVAALAGGLMLAATAQADITGSSVTTPTDPSFFIFDGDAATNTFAVSGTTTGGTPATDQVDLECYYANTSLTVKSGVSLNPDGTFSVPDAPLAPFGDRACRLRAIPATTAPADLTPFAGPRLGVGERRTNTLPPGTNAGVAYDYYIFGQQLGAAFDYDSLAGCGVDDGYLFDNTFKLTTTTFYCNAYFGPREASPPTRSELRIDGANAYPPAAAKSINSHAAGFPAVAHSYTLDPHTGDLVIHESEPLVKCSDPTYPPTVASCATLVPTGVSDNRTIVQDHDGHLTTLTDVFTSTDHAAHALDLLWENDQRFHGAGGLDSTHVAFRFPGQSTFSTHVAGDLVSLPAAAPGTVLIHVDGAPDGDPTTGQGAIVYDRPASSARFTYSAATSDQFTLHQTGTVPAGGTTTYRFAYAQAYTAAEVAALAQGAAQSLPPEVPPTVHIAGPGAVVHTPSVTVSGTATDDGGITSLTVGGHAVAVGAGGAWSTTVALNSGANSIAAVATDDRGNTGQAQVTVTYQPTTTPPPAKPGCTVPKLKGKTLKAAKKALTKANCGAGKVSRKRSRTIHKGRVVSTTPKAGKKLANNSKVKITLSRGRR
jgi:hypothetical protein